jgi:hypothetical protein
MTVLTMVLVILAVIVVRKAAAMTARWVTKAIAPD